MAIREEVVPFGEPYEGDDPRFNRVKREEAPTFARILEEQNKPRSILPRRKKKKTGE
ncbi:hypothetical protein SAMN05444392_1069 [Seinonella peptonophila]|uniref:Uncharacterized protein n=1 Tax=Seinonella peptonophila TaxID=112248 RepID=A0A1M4Y3L6_9BACL|nr:hypothetical protein [Seinonella peptonophila]SHF00173.1 hypothetical protein SAMN05444392_1069 [Seinonella peptonophila]